MIQVPQARVAPPKVINFVGLTFARDGKQSTGSLAPWPLILLVDGISEESSTLFHVELSQELTEVLFQEVRDGISKRMTGELDGTARVIATHEYEVTDNREHEPARNEQQRGSHEVAEK